MEGQQRHIPHITDAVKDASYIRHGNDFAPSLTSVDAICTIGMRLARLTYDKQTTLSAEPCHH